MKEYLLEPQNDTRKSFYGKAKVVEEYNSVSLISYNSCICQIQVIGQDDARVKIYNVKDSGTGESLTFSKTSLRHLKEFLVQNGFKADSKHQIVKDYDICEAGYISIKH